MEAFTSVGFLHRKGLQYHWRNRDRNSASSSSISEESTISDSSGASEPSTLALEWVLDREQGVKEAECHAAKYRDFDGYLGNFASKRRIKVCFHYL